MNRPETRSPSCRGCGRRDKVFDRFIHPRLLSREPRWGVGGLDLDDQAHDDEPQSILEKNPLSSRRREYRRLLAAAVFDLAPGACVGGRVLPMWPCGGGGLAAPDAPASDRYWPVRARSNPLIGGPEMRLSLPELPKGTGHTGTGAGGSRWRLEWRVDQLVDWGACGSMAVAGRNAVYLWRDAHREHAVGVGAAGATELLVDFEDDDGPLALCWSPRPDQPLLVIGTKAASAQVQVWDCHRKEALLGRRLPDRGAVTAIAWHPYEDVIAVGTSKGFVHFLSSSLTLIKTYRSHATASPGGSRCGLSRLAFSPVDGSLLACGGTDGMVVVLDWVTGLIHGVEVDTLSTVTALSWHPWKGSVLAVGSLAGDITLMNFAKCRVTTAQYRGRRGRLVGVTALSFSPRTGELVVAFSGKGDKQVVVLSDLKTVVDRVLGHADTVQHLRWSPDGAVLATAGSDEMLCVWNFLGAKATRELRRKALQHAREVRSGLTRQFGCVIR